LTSTTKLTDTRSGTSASKDHSSRLRRAPLPHTTSFLLSATEIGPFSVRYPNHSLLPSTLMGPFYGRNFRVRPKKFYKLMDRCATRSQFPVHVHTTKWTVRRVKLTMVADLGRANRSSTVHESSPRDHFVVSCLIEDNRDPRKDRSAASSGPDAALHAVTDYVSVSQPTPVRRRGMRMNLQNEALAWSTCALRTYHRSWSSKRCAGWNNRLPAVGAVGNALTGGDAVHAVSAARKPEGREKTDNTRSEKAACVEAGVYLLL